MDFEVSGRRFHLPAELVDLVIYQLRDTISDIRNVRLTCKIFARSATRYIYNMFETPSPLLPAPDNTSRDTLLSWPLIDPPGYTSIKVLTSLTCATIRRLDGSEMLKLRDLIWAPHDHIETDRPSAIDGRLATMWGVTQETPVKLWLIHQWPSKEIYKAYCEGRYAADLAQYLDEIAPGCLLRSSTEFCTLPKVRRRRNPFFSGYGELRTLYFPSDMSYDQRRAFEKDMHVDPQWRERNPPFPLDTGMFYICWIQGLRLYKQTPAVAARLIIFWGDPQQKESWIQDVKTGETWSLGLGLVLSEEDLAPFGLLGIESEHCEFSSGPFA
ncbi:unnamed protein product [Cercospora beticola]|nr:unnamed protein product [Cercospora beticola]